MINRRDVLRMGLSAGAGLLAAPRKLLAQTAMPGMNMASASPQPTPTRPAQPAPQPMALASYVTPLAIPAVIRPHAGGAPTPIHIRPFRHRAHRDLSPTAMWVY